MLLPRFCLITNRMLCDNLLYVVEEALRGGVRMIQLREKDLVSREWYHLAVEMRRLTRKYNALLIVNDRVDVALSVGADGIHVGKSSLPIPVIKKMISSHKKMLIGYSSHSLSEVQEVAREGVDWVSFSPIYYTPSKERYGEPQGIDRLKEVIKAVDIPVYALGGISIDNIDDVMATGCYGVSLISEIISSKNPYETTLSLLSHF